MKGYIGLDVNFQKGPLFGKAQHRAERPLAAGVGRQLVAIMRRGPGSVDDQFERQRELTPLGGYRNWKPTRAFGTRPAPAATLDRSGGYREAWIGLGPGTRQEITEDSVSIGVDPRKFPQVTLLQSFSPISIAVTRKMVGYVYRNFKVWLGRKDSIVVQPRRVNIGLAAVNRSKAVVAAYVATGVVGADR